MPAQLVELGLKPASSSPSQAAFRRIAEREGDLALALLQQVQILDRGLGGLHLGLHVRNLVAVDLPDATPSG